MGVCTVVGTHLYSYHYTCEKGARALDPGRGGPPRAPEILFRTFLPWQASVSHARASLTMDLLKRGYQHGLADWVTTFIIAGLGLCAEKGLAPFEHELGPQLADPHISYPYTPNAQSHCPKSLLIALAFILPLALIASTQLLAPSTLDLNHALLGMISSLSYTLLLVALIKAAVGRLRPDFLARCVPVDGVCTGVPAEVTEGRKSASCQPPSPAEACR